MTPMPRAQFEQMLVDGPSESRVRKHAGQMRTIADWIVCCVPPSGNLAELGDHRAIKRELIGRVKAHGILATGDAASTGGHGDVTFGPLFLVLLGAALQFLIEWWFSNKTHATATLAALYRENLEAANGHRRQQSDPE